nr:hypothetical protein [Tanacetum cinerariifolium]
MSNHNRIYVTPSHTKKKFGNMKRVGKGFSGRDTPLFPTMIVQAQEEIGNLEERTFRYLVPTSVTDEAVNEEMDDSLERATTTATSLDAEQDRARVESFKDKSLDEEDASKQGRIADIDFIEDIYLVNVHKDKDIFGVNDSNGDEVIVEDADMLFDVVDDLRGEEVVVSQEVPLKEVSATIDVDEVNVISTATTTTATINDITLAKAPMEIKIAKPKTTAASI